MSLNHIYSSSVSSNDPYDIYASHAILANPLAVASGGTNSGTALSNGALMVSNAGKIVEGTSSSAPVFSGLVTGANFKRTGLGAVTQGTSITTAVVLNSQAGVITTFANSTTTTLSQVSFTLTNSTIASTSSVQCWVQAASGTGFAGCSAIANTIANGSCVITLTNGSGSTWNAAVFQIGFNVLS